MNILKDRSFLFFVLKFLAIFSACYFGTGFIIGLTVKGGYYSEFVVRYLDYVKLLRNSLLGGTKLILLCFGIKTYMVDNYILRMVNGRGIRLVYSCLGYGVMSFWFAFVASFSIKIKRKIGWIIFGCFVIWVLNVIRLSFLLVATNKGWPMPFGLDHHTWFNILSYLFIFCLIYLFSRQNDKHIVELNKK